MENKNEESVTFPKYCDFSCKYADFAEKDFQGDCRKEIAVFCKHFHRLNNKHSKCISYKIDYRKTEQSEKEI